MRCVADPLVCGHGGELKVLERLHGQAASRAYCLPGALLRGLRRAAQTGRLQQLAARLWADRPYVWHFVGWLHRLRECLGLHSAHPLSLPCLKSWSRCCSQEYWSCFRDHWSCWSLRKAPSPARMGLMMAGVAWSTRWSARAGCTGRDLRSRLRCPACCSTWHHCFSRLRFAMCSVACCRSAQHANPVEQRVLKAAQLCEHDSGVAPLQRALQTSDVLLEPCNQGTSVSCGSRRTCSEHGPAYTLLAEPARAWCSQHV